jgi:aspartate aminotransferase
MTPYSIQNAFDPIVTDLLRSQEWFEELREAWTLRAGQKFCDLSYANPYDGTAESVLSALREALDDRRLAALQYTPYGGYRTVRRAVAEEVSRGYAEKLHWRDIVLTPGATAGLNILFRSLRGTSGPCEVIVPVPCWLDYPLYLVENAHRPVLVPLQHETLRLDVDRIAAAITPATRAVIISQPVNPTGLVHSREELESLADALSNASRRIGNDITLISDECHRSFVFESSVFCYPARVYELTYVVYSFGKSILMQGQRAGYIAIPPSHPNRLAISRLFERYCRTTGFCTPTALMQLALPRLVSYRPDLAPILNRREKVIAALGGAGYSVIPSQATFFLYVRCPRSDEHAFVEDLARRGVFVLPSSMFNHSGYIRISLTATDAMIDRALSVFRELAT